MLTRYVNIVLDLVASSLGRHLVRIIHLKSRTAAYWVTNQNQLYMRLLIRIGQLQLQRKIPLSWTAWMHNSASISSKCCEVNFGSKIPELYLKEVIFNRKLDSHAIFTWRAEKLDCVVKTVKLVRSVSGREEKLLILISACHVVVYLNAHHMWRQE